MTTAQNVINVARKYVGQGPTIFASAFGMPGQPWCAMFASYVLREAGVPADGRPWTALVTSVRSWAQARGRWVTSGPQVGDLACVNPGVPGSHVTIVAGVHADGTLTTIGGNEYGVSGPYIVREQRRSRDWVRGVNGYARPAYASGPTPPTPGGSGTQTNVVALTTGGFCHAIRRGDGSWTVWGNVLAETGNLPGPILQASNAGQDRSEHVTVRIGDGRLFHCLRSGDGQWSRFLPLPVTMPGPAARVATVTIGVDLHVAAVIEGAVYHTIRFGRDGSWQDLRNAGTPGSGARDLAIASVNGELHLAVVTNGGGMHSIRHANGAWDAWQQFTPYDYHGVAAAGTGGDLQLLLASTNGSVWHTARMADGNWTPGGAVLPEIGYQDAVSSVAAARVDDQLAALILAPGGRLYHTIRYVSGAWQPVGTVPLNGIIGAIAQASLTMSHS